MKYRLYKPDDFDALYAIETVCFEPPLRFERAYLRQLTRARNSATWVAEENDGKPVGFAVVEWRPARGGRVAGYIATIEVLPEHRRVGAGGALLGRVEVSAREAGADAIWLHVDARNEVARRLYEKHGYTEAGASENFYGPGQGARILVKDLAKDVGKRAE